MYEGEGMFSGKAIFVLGGGGGGSASPVFTRYTQDYK